MAILQRLLALITVLVATACYGSAPYVPMYPNGDVPTGNRFTNGQANGFWGTNFQGNGLNLSNVPVPLSNTLYVALNGNDATAARGTRNAFKTLTNALQNAQYGDLIKVAPGQYTNHNLLKNGVSWYFEPGATVYWFQHTGEYNAPGQADPGNTDYIGIFDDRTSGPVTNVIVGGYGDFVFAGPGVTNTITGLVGTPATNPISTPFMIFNGYTDWRTFSNAALGTFPLVNTLGAVVFTNPFSSFTMTANSIAANFVPWNLGDTNTGGSGHIPQVAFGQYWDIYVTNCGSLFFNIKTLKSWSGSNGVPGDLYGVPVIDNDVIEGAGNYTNWASGNGANPFNSQGDSAPIVMDAGGAFWVNGDMHLNVEKLEPMAGPGNNGIWTTANGSTFESMWMQIKDMETYWYDNGTNPNYRVWLDFQQCKDTHNGFGGLTLQGYGKVYIRGEKLMHPTNNGPVLSLAAAALNTPSVGEIWMNIQKISFDTNPPAIQNTTGSSWIQAPAGSPKLFLNCEEFEDTGNAIDNFQGIGSILGAAAIQIASTNGVHIRGQNAVLGSGIARFLDINNSKATNIFIEGFHIDARQDTATNLITLNGNTNVVLRNIFAQCGAPNVMTNFIGSPSSSNWVTLQGVYSTQSNGLNISVTNGMPASMHWP